MEVIPKVLTFSINRIEFNNNGRRKHTPILCDRILNLRGMTAHHYDETDVKCTLFAAILHKGIGGISCGHFVSYVFNTEHTAILYDDELVKEVSSKKLITSTEFMKNVYMHVLLRKRRQVGCK